MIKEATSTNYFTVINRLRKAKNDWWLLLFQTMLKGLTPFL